MFKNNNDGTTVHCVYQKDDMKVTQLNLFTSNLLQVGNL